MKHFKSYLILFMIFSLTFSVKAQNAIIKNNPRAEQNENKSHKKRIEYLERDVKALNDWTNGIIGVVAALGTASIIFLFFFRKKIINAVGRDIIIDVLASKIEVEKNSLEATIKALVKDFSARNNRKVFILSKGTKDQIAKIRTLLIGAGFNRDNFDFDDFQSPELELKDIDLIIFNDKYDPGFEVSEMEEFIKRNKNAIDAYLYFGDSNQLPISDWKTKYQIKMTGANFDDSLPRNLLSILKTLN